MRSFAAGKFDVYLGPTELGAPDDLEQAIVDGATTSLDIAVQEIDSLKIAEAIINARWRGVITNVFVEQDYIRTKLEKNPEPPVPDVAAGETPAEALYRFQWRSDQETADEDVKKKRESLAINRVILGALLRNGVEVKGDFNPKIFHQRFIIRDYPAAKPTSALLAGSANFTHHDTHDNLNNVFVVHDPKICREYVGEFKRLERGQFGRGALGDVPETIDLNGVPVKICFAPDHSPELEIMKQLLTVGTGGVKADLKGTSSGLRSSPSTAPQGSTTPCSRSLAAGSRSWAFSTADRQSRSGHFLSGSSTRTSSSACPHIRAPQASRCARCTTRPPSSMDARSLPDPSTTRGRRTTSTTRTSSSWARPTTRSRSQDARRSRSTRTAARRSRSTCRTRSSGCS